MGVEGRNGMAEVKLSPEGWTLPECKESEPPESRGSLREPYARRGLVRSDNVV